MAKYIPLDAILAEIEKETKTLKQEIPSCENKEHKKGKLFGLQRALYLIDTLEVKEVDLEDSIKESLAQKYIDYTFKRHNIDPESKEGQLIYHAYMHGMNQCLTQLKAQKGG